MARCGHPCENFLGAPLCNTYFNTTLKHRKDTERTVGSVDQCIFSQTIPKDDSASSAETEEGPDYISGIQDCYHSLPVQHSHIDSMMKWRVSFRLVHQTNPMTLKTIRLEENMNERVSCMKMAQYMLLCAPQSTNMPYTAGIENALLHG